jgi:hypothetical protein
MRAGRGIAIRGLLRRTGLTAVILIGWSVAALAGASPARAADPASAEISVDAPDQAVIGQEVAVSARLTSNGQPVRSRLLGLLVDGNHLRNASVDTTGTARFTIRRGELSTARDAIVTVSYDGSAALAAASATATIHVRPARVVVETVPASDNVILKLGSLTAVTKDGKATFDVGKVATYTLEMITGATVAPDTRADFVRWGDNVFRPKRSVNVSGDLTLQLGLHVAYRQSFTFRDGAGRPVDPRSIESVTLTSTGGDELVLHGYSDVWLGAGTAVKRATGLEVSPRSWRVLEVEIAGSNVVNRGQQAIEPRPASTASIEVLLYDLGVTAHDALFGLPMRGTLDLVFPDGTVRQVALDAQTDTVHFDRLPRGDYTIRLKTSGLGAPTPVALSRDQVAVIRVISYLDIGVFAAVVVIGLATLLWIGRRHQVLAAAGRSREVVLRGGSGALSRVVAIRSPVSRLGPLPIGRAPSLDLPAPPPMLVRTDVQPPAAAPTDSGPRRATLAEVVSGTIDRRPMSTASSRVAKVGRSPGRTGQSAIRGTQRQAQDRSHTAWWRSCPACRRRVSPRAGYCPSCGVRVEQ